MQGRRNVTVPAALPSRTVTREDHGKVSIRKDYGILDQNPWNHGGIDVFGGGNQEGQGVEDERLTKECDEQMDQKWTKTEQDGYILIENEGGQTLGLAADSKVKVLTVEGYAFKDFLGTGELARSS